MEINPNRKIKRSLFQELKLIWVYCRLKSHLTFLLDLDLTFILSLQLNWSLSMYLIASFLEHVSWHKIIEYNTCSTYMNTDILQITYVIWAKVNCAPPVTAMTFLYCTTKYIETFTTPSHQTVSHLPASQGRTPASY